MQDIHLSEPHEKAPHRRNPFGMSRRCLVGAEFAAPTALQS